VFASPPPFGATRCGHSPGARFIYSVHSGSRAEYRPSVLICYAGFDLLQSHSEGAGALAAATYTAGTDKWQRRPEFDLPFAVAKDGLAVARYALARWSGGPGSDLLYQSDGHSGFLRNTAAGWQADDRYKPPFDLSRPFWLVDVDCSGTPALLVSTNDASGKARWGVYRYGASKWDDASAAFALPFPADTPAAAIRVISKGPSGCAQVLVAAGGGIHDLLVASAGGWVHSNAGPPPFDRGFSAGSPRDWRDPELLHAGYYLGNLFLSDRSSKRLDKPVRGKGESPIVNAAVSNGGTFASGYGFFCTISGEHS
jgi:hypothetical protein